MKVEKLLVGGLFFILLSGCQCSKKEPFPDHLIGLWRTETPPYADRFFEIKKDEIIFGTGTGTRDSHAIVHIETEKGRGEEMGLHTIHYKDREGEKQRFSFFYDPAMNGVIRLKNQKQIAWTRQRI